MFWETKESFQQHMNEILTRKSIFDPTVVKEVRLEISTEVFHKILKNRRLPASNRMNIYDSSVVRDLNCALKVKTTQGAQWAFSSEKCIFGFGGSSSSSFQIPATLRDTSSKQELRKLFKENERLSGTLVVIEIDPSADAQIKKWNADFLAAEKAKKK